MPINFVVVVVVRAASHINIDHHSFNFEYKEIANRICNCYL